MSRNLQDNYQLPAPTMYMPACTHSQLKLSYTNVLMPDGCQKPIWKITLALQGVPQTCPHISATTTTGHTSVRVTVQSTQESASVQEV